MGCLVHWKHFCNLRIWNFPTANPFFSRSPGDEKKFTRIVGSIRSSVRNIRNERSIGSSIKDSNSLLDQMGAPPEWKTGNAQWKLGNSRFLKLLVKVSNLEKSVSLEIYDLVSLRFKTKRHCKLEVYYCNVRVVSGADHSFMWNTRLFKRYRLWQSCELLEGYLGTSEGAACVGCRNVC